MDETRLVKPYKYNKKRRITGFRIADTKRLIDFEYKLGDKSSITIGRASMRGRPYR